MLHCTVDFKNLLLHLKDQKLVILQGFIHVNRPSRICFVNRLRLTIEMAFYYYKVINTDIFVVTVTSEVTLTNYRKIRCTEVF